MITRDEVLLMQAEGCGHAEMADLVMNLEQRIAELEQKLAIDMNVIRDYETENARLKEQIKSYFLTRKEIEK